MNTFIEFSSLWQTPSEKERGWNSKFTIAPIRRIVSTANPDFEDLYDRVTTWHVETDASSGRPLREIGIDCEGQIVAIGPWRRNYGFIVDSPVRFQSAAYTHISAAQFENEWNSFIARKLAEPAGAAQPATRSEVKAP